MREVEYAAYKSLKNYFYRLDVSRMQWIFLSIKIFMLCVLMWYELLMYLFFLFSFQCIFGSYLTFYLWAGSGERKWEEKIKLLNGVHSEFTVDLNSHILYLTQVFQSCDFTACVAEYWNYFPKLSSCGYSAVGENQKSEFSLPFLIPGCVLCSWLVLVWKSM